MEYLSEQLALARIREGQVHAEARLHADALARELRLERRALAWDRLARWATKRAQRARCC